MSFSSFLIKKLVYNANIIVYLNLYFIGIEASRVLTFGDSLTKGYFNGGKSFHPYGEKVELLLNKDDHRCFVLEISGKNGEQSDHMLQRLSEYLNISK
jgi:lysophospholipase L1-like esterase